MSLFLPRLGPMLPTMAA